MGLFGGSYSPYTYTNGNPINEVDPSGLESGAAYAALMRADGFQLPGPPGYVSPEVKAYLCKLINECKGDLTCVFNKANAERRGGTANPKTWNDPFLRNVENFATAAAHGTTPYGYTSHTPEAIVIYQYVIKPYIYPIFNIPSSPVSDEAAQAGIAGSNLYSRSSAEALKWCNDCGKQ